MLEGSLGLHMDTCQINPMTGWSRVMSEGDKILASGGELPVLGLEQSPWLKVCFSAFFSILMGHEHEVCHMSGSVLFSIRQC